MLYNNPSKNKIGSDDPFNKKKLAEEAKQDQKIIEQNQKLKVQSQLREQAKNRQKDVDRLKVELAAKEKLVVNIGQSIDLLKRETVGLNNDLKKVSKTGVFFSSQNTNLKYKGHELKMKLDQALSEREKTLREIQRLTLDRDRKNRELALTERDLLLSVQQKNKKSLLTASLQEDVLSRSLADKRNALDNLKKEIEKLKRDLVSKISEQDHLVSEIRDLERKVSISAADKIKANQDKFEIEKETEGLKNKTTALKKEIDGINQQMEELQVEKSKLDKEMAELERETKEGLDSEAEEKRLAALRAKDSNNLEANLAGKKNNLAELERQRTLLANEVIKVKNDLTTKENEVKSLTLQASRI